MHISQILDENSLNGAFKKGQKNPRSYDKNSEYQYKPEFSRFKAVVWFKDGKTRYFYSFDNAHVYRDPKHIGSNPGNKRIVIVDEFEGAQKLFRMIAKFRGKFKNAYIYTTIHKEFGTKKANYNIPIYKENINGTILMANNLQMISDNLNSLVNIKSLILDCKKENFLEKINNGNSYSTL